MRRELEEAIGAARKRLYGGLAGKCVVRVVASARERQLAAAQAEAIVGTTVLLLAPGEGRQQLVRLAKEAARSPSALTVESIAAEVERGVDASQARPGSVVLNRGWGAQRFRARSLPLWPATV